jgi:hypothetical protein
MNWFNLPDTFPLDLTMDPSSPILSHVNFGQALALGLAVQAPPFDFLEDVRALLPPAGN